MRIHSAWRIAVVVVSLGMTYACCPGGGGRPIVLSCSVDSIARVASADTTRTPAAPGRIFIKYECDAGGGNTVSDTQTVGDPV